MKVFFDARMIDHPGIGRYIRCLLPGIVRDKSVDLTLLGNMEKINKFLPFQVKVIDFNYPIYSVQEQVGYLRLKKEIASSSRLRSGGTPHNDGILHVPHYNIPVLTGFKLVATVHDLIHIIYPEGASGRLAPAYMRFMMKRILKTASGIICVSKATKSEIEKRLLLPPNSGGIAMTKMEVIHEGIDEVFGRMDDKTFLEQVRKKYNLPDKFLLYVGSIRRHKNIATLLDAFDYFRRKNTEMRLVLVGRRSQDIDVKREGIMYLGEVSSDKELAAVYNMASCLFNLSMYEGFGLTILEAQKCGLPIVCSDIPVHREIAGQGAMFVNPSYIDQVYENLYNVSFDDSARQGLISRGTENAARFDWRSTAEKTVELYKKVDDEGCDSPRLAAGHAGRRKDPQCFLQNIPPS